MAAPQLWNNLPPYVRSAPTYVDFKSLLKTDLFTVAYGHNLSKRRGITVEYYLSPCSRFTFVFLVYTYILYSTLANSYCFV